MAGILCYILIHELSNPAEEPFGAQSTGQRKVLNTATPAATPKTKTSAMGVKRRKA